jgi:hypothetical protein
MNLFFSFHARVPEGLADSPYTPPRSLERL